MSQELFTRALGQYQQGNLDAADRLLRKSLERDPAHFDSVYLAGLVAARNGRVDTAVARLRRATQLKPSHPGVWCSMGRLLADNGYIPEGIDALTRAIALRPEFREAWVLRSAALSRARRMTEALADIDRALAIGADDANAHVIRAALLIDLQRPSEAAESCRRALARQPHLPAAHVNLAGALHQMGDHAGAAAAARAALAAAPADANAHAHLGASLMHLGNLDEALAHVTRAIELDPQHAIAHNTRALCLLDLGRVTEGLESCRRAIELQPDRADAYNTRGLLQSDATLAMRDFEHAIALQPEASEPRYNKGVRLLLRGDLREGWELYEFRKRPLFREIDRDRLWNGSEEIAGKTFFTYSEQGLGDTIQFSRYAKVLAARGARVVLCVQDCLCAVLSGLDPNVTVIGQHDRLPDFDRHFPLLSLPRALDTTLESIPNAVPYVFAREDRIAKWRDRLGVYPGRRIAIRWQGSTGRVDVGRSFPLQEFAPIATLDQVQLVSLQKGPGSEQLSLARDWPVKTLGDDFEVDERHSFLDVAAIMQLVDLIITSDTSIAHLAGAVGRPTWVVLKHHPDWRWLLGRSDCPWYPTMRLFRQPRPGDWRQAFASVRAALE
jgi:tetratricopeptide (TPR) repeat protein